MQIIRGLPGPSHKRPCAVAIGNFDGVHLGHKALISLAAARQNTSKSAVWTFAEPSSRFLNGKPGLLSSVEERLSLFHELGIDIVFIEDFENVRDMEADVFAKEILYQRCHVRAAVCGFNFRYGKNAAGTAETLSEAFHALGASVTVMPPYQIGGVTSKQRQPCLADRIPSRERSSREKSSGVCSAFRQPINAFPKGAQSRGSAYTPCAPSWTDIRIQASQTSACVPRSKTRRT